MKVERCATPGYERRYDVNALRHTGYFNDVCLSNEDIQPRCHRQCISQRVELLEAILWRPCIFVQSNVSYFWIRILTHSLIPYAIFVECNTDFPRDLLGEALCPSVSDFIDKKKD